MRVKRLKFNWLTAVALVLVAVTVTALIGNLSGGFQNGVSDWKLREVNEDNLYQSLTFGDKNGVWASGENGISVKLKDDNSIKVSGTAEIDMEHNIGTIALKAGTAYVFDGSLKEGSNNSAYLRIVDENGVELATSYRGPVLITADKLTVDTNAVIWLKIMDETELNVTLRPVLCEGTSIDDVIDFYD